MPTTGMPPGSTRSLGILTTSAEQFPPFENRGFYRRLCLLGRKLGLRVFVFTPEGADWKQSRIAGFYYDAGTHSWVSGSFALPPLVYDRCFCTTRRQYADYRLAIAELHRRPGIRLLGCGLKGKWEVHRLLAADSRIARYLPETEPLRSMRTAAEWLKQYGEAVLKPAGGSQGRGVLHVRREAQGSFPRFTVRGRDACNNVISRSFPNAGELFGWLRRLIGRRRYLVQRYLQLHTGDGDAFDVRALVQKAAGGSWRLTGFGVRLGQNGSLTSNLHGGGRVAAAEPWLAREFGRERADALLEELSRLCEIVPEALEAGHGRLAELGLDFGIDRGGHIWLLEANSKPGRSIFTHLHDERAQLAAASSPLRYADYLLRHAGGSGLAPGAAMTVKAYRTADRTEGQAELREQK
ncbi:YheC/D like ATP-grasp [Paenibacillus sp. UNCCL117]|uniref:YheC/YheD family endospore coat-associated protein n=1 Tax=unclassified Paenibacillus TaxID=185978 RepID=UPI000883A213|nr:MULTISPECIES: YheC/YheD family protein [unclassified Paenibacillus]SDC08226.1 YheC/D like ATP-grasp [Paenibacillus sp. cl123]SFW38210.1 YheC/D like ATP-grasp [Paenibacillus sp. UNCCL117]